MARITAAFGASHSVMLAAGDTFRAAAREQLATWGERNGVPVIGQHNSDPAALVFDAVAALAAAKGIGIAGSERFYVGLQH